MTENQTRVDLNGPTRSGSEAVEKNVTEQGMSPVATSSPHKARSPSGLGDGFSRVDHDDDDVLIQTIMGSAERQVLPSGTVALVPPGAEPAFKPATMTVVASGASLQRTASTTIPPGTRATINPDRGPRV